VRNEYGFECHAKYLAGLERQVRGILTEIASYNSVHHTLFEPKESQSVWERSRQTRCGESPSWDPGKIDQSFTQMQCYLDITEDRFQQLDNFVHQLPP
jgi:uncharacterized protein YecT (DUF1311 family)